MLLASCEKIILAPAPASDKISVFEEYWKLVNEKYAMLEFKHVDWQMVYDTTKPKITEAITDAQFFDIMGSMVTHLRDAHSWISNDGINFKGWDKLHDGYEANSNLQVLFEKYLTDFNFTKDTGILYTILQDNIGYMLVPEFEGFDEKDIESVIKSLETTKGLILDVRDNGGGDPSLAADLASHFTDTEVYAGFERFKSGPGENDFADSKMNLLPTRGTYYDKPVMVLTNRGCYSATTTMIYMMNPLPQVTFIGDRTGGGSGSVSEGYLANGWIWAMSTSEFIDFEGRHLDDGFDPDIPVQLDLFDLTEDAIIERALAELSP